MNGKQVSTTSHPVEQALKKRDSANHQVKSPATSVTGSHVDSTEQIHVVSQPETRRYELIKLTVSDI